MGEPGGEWRRARSNYCAGTVDLAAPGVNIASAWPGRQWALLDGTSMATPHVTGAAVLALTANPRLDTAGLRRALLSSADPVPALAGRVVTGGRLNAARAVAAGTGSPPPADDTAAAQPAPRPPAPQPQPAQSAPATSAAPAPTAPAGAPAATVAPARAPDRIAPGLTVAPVRTTRAAALARGFRATVRCSERCTLSVRLTAGGASARRFGRTATATLARAAARISSAGARTVALRPSAGVRRRLARAGTVRLAVSAAATDAAGNRRARSAAIVLRAR